MMMVKHLLALLISGSRLPRVRCKLLCIKQFDVSSEQMLDFTFDLFFTIGDVSFCQMLDAGIWSATDKEAPNVCGINHHQILYSLCLLVVFCCDCSLLAP
jgi:hypothetical protein